ncbi:MAG: UvrD-helicase domain-containing protein [Dysosmobacter sp.]
MGALRRDHRWRRLRIQPSAAATRHVLVVAGPGAGKTGLLAQKAAFLFQTDRCREPQKILAISFKTDAAQNLRERVEQRCGKDIRGRFVSMTYDAFAKSILDHFLYALPDELRPAHRLFGRMISETIDISVSL